MWVRRSWQRRIADAWRKKNVLWLVGVRRTGKTSLCQSLSGIEYLDCELPSVRRQVQDPEAFLEATRGRRIVLDEIHRLPNPTELLKIAADHYPTTRVLATGSSTLGASHRFRDTLTGRKAELWLTPMTLADLADFEQEDLEHRLLHGGLPPFFLAAPLEERGFADWLDSFWAKDILELFRLERKQSFQRFAELLMARSGGIHEATAYAKPCEVSRTTIANYLAVLEATFVCHVVRPFSTNPVQEIVAAPKVYAFDTGFVCTWRGWHALRPEDVGLLWEHFVLNELHAHLQHRDIRYWRTKHGNELDFVLQHKDRPPTVIECKRSADAFEPEHLKAFRDRYPGGKSFVVATDVRRAFERRFGTLRVSFVGLAGLIEAVTKRGR